MTLIRLLLYHTAERNLLGKIQTNCLRNIFRGEDLSQLQLQRKKNRSSHIN